MKEQFQRTELLLGEDAMVNLENARVAVFGVGGVGGYVCEALVRSGVGTFELIDKDDVDITNLNRQIIATLDTVGKDKVDVMKARMLSINPDVVVNTHKCFFLPENADDFHFEDYDYVVDAIDTVKAKIELIMRAKAAGTPIISAMGAGNKLDPSRFMVADISKTSICPLAKVMRKELRVRGINHVKVVYSDEIPVKPVKKMPETDEPVELNANGRPVRKKDTPGSTAFAPAVAGLLIASEIVRDLTGR